MATFLRLSNMLINTARINSIKFGTGGYHLHVQDSNLSGTMLWGSGWVNIQSEKIIKITEKVDIDLIDEFIKLHVTPK